MKYRYIGKENLQYEDANDEYYLNIAPGDTFTVTEFGKGFRVVHDNASGINFFLTLKEMRALKKECEETIAIQVDPNNAPYLIFEPKIEIVRPLYDYFNKMLFNSKCPVVKIVKTHKRGNYGLAQMNWVNRKPVFTLHLSPAIMVDRKMFCNALVHEMIHLYNYAVGHTKLQAGDTDAMDHIHADHGPIFQREMHRINGHGFQIDVTAGHEFHAGAASERFYGLLAYPNGQKAQAIVFWSPLNHQTLLEDFANKITVKYPHAAWQVLAVETTDKNFVRHNKLGNVTQVPNAKLKLETVPELNYRVLKEHQLEAVSAYIIPTEKDDPGLYVMPLNRFLQGMSRKAKGVPQNILEQRWKTTTLRLVNKHAEQAISSLVGRVARNSISQTEVLNEIVDIREMYKGRFPTSQYEDAIKAFIKRYDPKGYLIDYASMFI